MVKNYFIIALRTFLKNKVFAAINSLGLAIGISSSLVIYLLVNYHFSFDRFEKDRNRIYRVVTDFNFSGQEYYNSGVTQPMGPAMINEVAGLDAVVPFYVRDMPVKVIVPEVGKNNPIVFKKENNFVFADEKYFSLIGYNWIAGSAATATKQPYQSVLTLSRAKKYFPSLTPAQIIGKELILDDTVRTSISGVVNDIEANTDFTFKVFISYPTLILTSLRPDDWGMWDNTNSASQLLVKLGKLTDVAQTETKLLEIYNRNNPPAPNRGEDKTEFKLQPLNDIHFNINYGIFSREVAVKSTLYSLLAVAAFLLLLGCINFINLTTAHATQRAREIGVRKTLGSSKSQLVFQFLCEAFLFTFVATLLSIALTPLILKAFSGFIPGDLHFNLAAQPSIILFLLLLMIVVTFLSGFYPALVLSGHKPVLVLKNQVHAGTHQTRQTWFRRSLTISQFIIAQVFIMATVVVSKQVNYTLSKDLGLRKDAIIYFSTKINDTAQGRKQILLNQLRAIPEIVMVSLASSPPASSNVHTTRMTYTDGQKEIESEVQLKYADTNYLKLYSLKLLAGSNIEQTDTIKSFIINENYAQVLGFLQPQQAVGKLLQHNGRPVPIAGVVADFHQKSLHEPIKPLAIGSWTAHQNTISLLLNPGNERDTHWKSAITNIERLWNVVYTEDEFSYVFFDEDISKFYEQEKNISGILKWATGLAVFISCLGILGLIIYTTSQRTKEIGIRKILGASVLQILGLLTRDLILLVLLAFVIATPIAWVSADKWLENFAYRIDVSWWIFVVTGMAAILIALITVSFQVIKTAVANPVKSLRTE